VHTKRPHYVPKTYLGARANSALLLGASAVTVRLQKIEKNSFRRAGWPTPDLTTQGDLRGERRSLLSVFAAIQFARPLNYCQQTNFLHNVAVTTDERPIPRPPCADMSAKAGRPL